MLKLVLFRHAKSAWDDPTLDDFDRGLADRGIRAAPLMAQWIADNGHLPDVVLCSSAVRTRATLTLAAEALGLHERSVRYDDRLYLADAPQIGALVRELADDETTATSKTALVFGHNPGLHAFALECVGRGPSDAMKRLATKVPTASVIVIQFAGEAWSALAPAAGELRAFETPKTVCRA